MLTRGRKTDGWEEAQNQASGLDLVMGFVDMLLELAGDLSARLFGCQGLAPRGTGGGEKTSSQSEHLKTMGAPATCSVTMSVGIWSLT